LVSDGQVLPQHTKLIQSLNENQNLMLQPQAARGNWAAGLNIKDLTQEKSAVVFHAGCRISYDAELRQTAVNAVNLLKKCGLDFGILGSGESCCGGRAYDMGYRQDFNNCAARNIAAWKKAGVKTVVTACADCYYAIKRLYPAAGAQFEVLHMVEYIDKLIQAKALEFKHSVPLKVTYHDPCHLGRQGEPYVPWQGKEKKIHGQMVVYEPRKPRYTGAWGIYAPPRNILKAIPGLQLVEMERNRECAWCCGGGGGVPETYPQFSAWTAGERVSEAKSTGAEAIVSACPGCERNFKASVKGSGEAMRVYDIIDLVQQAI